MNEFMVGVLIIEGIVALGAYTLLAFGVMAVLSKP
jgi:hypothetical protein